jgi:hypothetical protein
MRNGKSANVALRGMGQWQSLLVVSLSSLPWLYCSWHNVMVTVVISSKLSTASGSVAWVGSLGVLRFKR